jgi:aspartate/methionine/tyrosine aminotransferase
MTDVLLAKPTNLDPGTIDTSVGEAHVVREALYKVFALGSYQLPYIPCMEYPLPTGYPFLTRLLEDKYQHPVVITNGAKQALSATFYSLQRMGKKRLGFHRPYWALIPPLVEMHGLKWLPTFAGGFGVDSWLVVSPNNPDGWMPPFRDDWKEITGPDVPVIHDAAYYTHTYLPPDHQLPVVGDAQIYSASKMLGLSGARIGWVVCPNHDFYQLITEYMETSTVGVSVLSQRMVYDLMTEMKEHPDKTQLFEQTAAQALRRNKELMLQVTSPVLQVPQNLPDVPGMFLFCKGDLSLLEQAKVNVIDGKHFGAPGYVRINLALPEEQIVEIVHRLNRVT